MYPKMVYLSFSCLVSWFDYIYVKYSHVSLVKRQTKSSRLNVFPFLFFIFLSFSFFYVLSFPFCFYFRSFTIYHCVVIDFHWKERVKRVDTLSIISLTPFLKNTLEWLFVSISKSKVVVCSYSGCLFSE